MAAFATSSAFTLKEEGGYCQIPDDPGGPTNFGITMATLSHWRGHQCTPGDVRNMPRTEAVAIYHAEYWLRISGDDLPNGIDLMVFDFAINAGVGTSAMELQRILNLRQDGDIGPLTLKAVECTGAVLRARIASLGALHTAHYHMLPKFSKFGKGWTARVQRCQAAAMALTIHAPVLEAETVSMLARGSVPRPVMHSGVTPTAPDPADALNAAEITTIAGE